VTSCDDEQTPISSTACVRACVRTIRILSHHLNQLLAAKVNEKTGITSRLTELIMASEKKRDAKLNEIMKKMSVDGGAGAGAGAKGPPR